jgi:hypothetical protein
VQSDELKSTLKDFISNFGNSPKEPETEFAPSVKGALYLMHGDRVQQCLSPGAGTLIGDLAKELDDQATLNRLFLSVLTRKTTDEEQSELLSFLEKNKERRGEALANLAWAMLTSTEFVVNH